MEDKLLFDEEIILDKNSREFDLILLEELKSLKNIPVKKFDTIVRTIMRKKSSCKLWISYNLLQKWDGKELRETNYECCPTSRKARSYFCLVIDKKDEKISVLDGFLSTV